MDAQRQVGLGKTSVALQVEKEKRELVGGIVAVRVNPANNKVVANGKACKEAGGLGGAHCHDGVALEIEALEKLPDLLVRGARALAGTVVRQQVLIHAAERERAGV